MPWARTFLLVLGFASLVLVPSPGAMLLADTPSTSPGDSAPARHSPTNTEAQSQAVGQLRRELNAARDSLEQSRQSFEADSRQRSDRLGDQLSRLEHELESQRKEKEQVLRLVESANQQNLFYAAMFISVVLVAVVALAFFQLRATSKLAELVASAASGRIQVAAPPPPALEFTSVQPLESQLLVRSVERLENRIKELESTTLPRLSQSPTNPAPAPSPTSASRTEVVALPEAPPAPSVAPSRPVPTPFNPGSIAPEVEAALEKANGRHLVAGSQTAQKLIEAHLAAAELTGDSVIGGILGRGEAQLKLGHAEAALKSFEEAIQMDSTNPDAWVKKGSALEKLDRMEEAIVCYDRAIALDRNTTLAYLYKGGICNRLERFDEALACYEEALKNHEHPKAS